MRSQRKFLPFLYLFLISLLPLGIFMLLVSPEQNLEIFNLVIHPAIFLLILVFISSFFLFSFLFVNKRRGLLASIFVAGFLILRFFEIKSIYHTLLLLAIILLIEFLNSKRPSSNIRKGKLV